MRLKIATAALALVAVAVSSGWAQDEDVLRRRTSGDPAERLERILRQLDRVLDRLEGMLEGRKEGLKGEERIIRVRRSGEGPGSFGADPFGFGFGFELDRPFEMRRMGPGRFWIEREFGPAPARRGPEPRERGRCPFCDR
jgi:hypothetical protein